MDYLSVSDLPVLSVALSSPPSTSAECWPSSSSCPHVAHIPIKTFSRSSSKMFKNKTDGGSPIKFDFSFIKIDIGTKNSPTKHVKDVF